MQLDDQELLSQFRQAATKETGVFGNHKKNTRRSCTGTFGVW